jgi:hypothetical protein
MQSGGRAEWPCGCLGLSVVALAQNAWLEADSWVRLGPAGSCLFLSAC